MIASQGGPQHAHDIRDKRVFVNCKLFQRLLLLSQLLRPGIPPATRQPCPWAERDKPGGSEGPTAPTDAGQGELSTCIPSQWGGAWQRAGCGVGEKWGAVTSSEPEARAGSPFKGILSQSGCPSVFSGVFSGAFCGAGSSKQQPLPLGGPLKVGRGGVC